VTVPPSATVSASSDVLSIAIENSGYGDNVVICNTAPFDGESSNV